LHYFGIKVGLRPTYELKNNVIKGNLFGGAITRRNTKEHIRELGIQA